MKRNPFRSERDAFRLFLLAGGAALFVVAVALVAGSKAAAVLGVAVLLFGLFHAMRWISEAISAPDKTGDGEDGHSPEG